MFLISWPGGSWEATLRLTLTILAAYLLVIWIALVFWTYRDIRQRTRDPIIQMVSVLLVLVFFLPGHWVYLILRPRHTLAEAYERSLEEEALLQELEDQKACPTCKRRIQDEYLVCPSCGVQLKEPCRSCAKPLSYAWVVCPYCGLPKTPRDRTRRPAATGAKSRAAVGEPATAPSREVASGNGGIVTRPTGNAATRDGKDSRSSPPGPRMTPAPATGDEGAGFIDATRET